MTSPIECAYSLLPPCPSFLSTSFPVKTAPRRSTSAHIPSLRRRPPSSLRRRHSTVPAGHGCKNDMSASRWIDEGSGEPGHPRLPSPEAPSPPHLERVIRSRRQTPVERTTRAPAVYGRKRRVLPSSDSSSPRHPEADSLRSPPPPVLFSPRTPPEAIVTGSSCMQDGWVVCSLPPTPRRPSISPPTLALPADGDDDDEPYLTPPPLTPCLRGPRREDQEVRSTGTPGRFARRGAWSTRLRPTPTRGVDALRRGKRWLSSSRIGVFSGVVISWFSSSSPARLVVFFLGVDGRTTPTRHPAPTRTPPTPSPRPSASRSFSPYARFRSLFLTTLRAPRRRGISLTLSPLRRASYLRPGARLSPSVTLSPYPRVVSR
ncbi:hypothetical protein DFH09DRAFT_1374860 [Mycena vulgaris]|nr:hypothetical protein DFH09DRAFT_1374860 [Mycena vulgaris]